MNTQIHRKQIVILALAMALAAASYWIPLPQSSDPYPSPSMLRESTNLSALTESITYAREPATIWRFPVIIQVQQTPIQAVSAPQPEARQSAQTLPAVQLMDQRDFVNDSNMLKPNAPLMLIKELDYDLKR
ncbi:MAG: hypothetical protein H6975_05060 [Gammaproteobacteria bacterium]|nr:hypothetical protein [Gammaproteobacteria bacterium]